ncbi:oligosaccharide flippase family protein, partial [candidate division WOR-3 bacterium]|nr:oligosaccharide flippase family protein [candidate division WOR-3 bacterium]
MNPTSARTGQRGRFARQALKLAAGTAIAQGLTLLAAPVLTRVYNPEAFGIAALFQSLVGIIAAVSCLRYEMAIMLPASDRRAADMFGLSLVLTVMVSAVTVLPAVFAAGPIARALNSPGIAPWIWLVPVGILLGGFTLAFNNWETRTGRFGRLSVARVAAAITTVGAMLFLGLAGRPSGGSRIVAMVLGSLAFCILIGSLVWRDDRGLLRGAVSRLGILAGARRFRRFPVFDTWSTLMNAISWQLPALLLSRFFSTAVVGHYALGFRTLQLPMSLVGTAIGQVFFRRAAIARHEGRLAGLVENAFGQLAKLGLFPLLLLSLVGRELFLF